MSTLVRYALIVLVVAAAVARATPAPCPQFALRNTPALRAGPTPLQTLATDLNGDGLTDLVSVNQTTYITVFLNIGNGAFAQGISVSIGGAAAHAAAAADFDGDGRTDIAFSNTSGFVGILRNTTAGPLSFESFWAFSVDSEPRSMVAADFDGDSKPDIAVANYAVQSVSVLRNTGSGSIAFAPKVNFSVGGLPVDIAAGDFNSDSKQDLIIANNSGLTASILRNITVGAGAVSFAPRLTVSLGWNPMGVTVADFDGDGRTDFAATAFLGSSVNVVRNTTVDPATLMFAAPLNFTSNSGPISLTAADFDADGRPDLAVANQSASAVSILRNNSGGAGDIAFLPKIEFGTGYGPNGIVHADLDADGKPDLATSDGSGNTLSVLRNVTAANGPIEFNSRRNYASGTGAFSTVSADFDLDGAFDLAVANQSTLSVFRNSGQGVFPTRTQYTGGTIGEIALGDFNLDNRTDIVFTEQSLGVGVVMLNTSAGGSVSFGPPITTGLGLTPKGLTVADFDGNSTPDYAVATSGSNKVGIVLNSGGVFTLGGSFTVGTQPQRVAAADFDGDGKTDIVSSNFGTYNLIFLRNTGTSPGSANFESVSPPLNIEAYDVAAADFDGDHRPDLAVTERGFVRILRNIGTGAGVFSFGPAVSYIGGVFPKSIVVTDFDRDGKPDIVASNEGVYNKGAAIFLNKSPQPGSIVFENGIDTPIGGGVSYVAVADFDNNGTKDLAAAGFGNVSVVPSECAAGRAPFDFDGDGRSDISVFRPSNGQWWLNRSTAGTVVHTFGNPADEIVPADFTGDGKTDVAFFRSGNGTWFVLRSEDATFYSFPFGAAGDVPVPADYDGDGRADAAIFRSSNATWYVQRSSGGITIQSFGSPTDVPVPADFDGDGKTDIAIYRPSLGQWWISRSQAGVIVHTFGNSADRAVPGDYTGDGKADVAIFRPSTGSWFVLRSEDFSFYSFPFGTSADVPVPGDYDGDGRFDAAVFRPSNATWYVQRSTAGTLIQGFGAATDRPVPNAFVR